VGRDDGRWRIDSRRGQLPDRRHDVRAREALGDQFLDVALVAVRGRREQLPMVVVREMGGNLRAALAASIRR